MPHTRPSDNPASVEMWSNRTWSGARGVGCPAGCTAGRRAGPLWAGIAVCGPASTRMEGDARTASSLPRVRPLIHAVLDKALGQLLIAGAASLLGSQWRSLPCYQERRMCASLARACIAAAAEPSLRWSGAAQAISEGEEGDCSGRESGPRSDRRRSVNGKCSRCWVCMVLMPAAEGRAGARLGASGHSIRARSTDVGDKRTRGAYEVRCK
jgi:hypothetical protein